jgi:hypothetical protein
MTQEVLGAGDTTYQQTITAPAITSGILDSGVVMMYFGYTDQNENNDVEPLENYMEAIYSQGSILLISYGTNYSTEAQVRYVVIPGKVLAGTSFQGMSRTQIKSMSYKQLTQALGNQLTPSGN